jgi:MFS family permease
MSTTKTVRADRAGTKLTMPIAALALVIAVAVQFIGQVKIDVGIGSIIIFPMVWGLILGLLVSIQKFKPLGIDLQRVAAALVGVAVLLLVARLAFNIGPSLPTLLKAGPALLLQEVGHLLGTIVLALPLAVLLRMGKATVGATFSLDREPSFAMVSEKYGPDSDQYRGVLAMYVFGTLFGAVYITLLTSLVANWKIFDPLALAMGAGVGSGSMMAASAASIVAGYPADQEAILGMAAVSNLITTILGVYVGIYIALPLADRFYKLLTRKQTAREEAAVTAGAPSGGPAARTAADIDREAVQAEENRRFRERVAESAAAMKLPLWLSLSVLTVLGIATASVAAKGFSLSIVGGYAVMLALVLVSIALAKATRKISAIVFITTIGAYISSPWFFAAEPLNAAVKTVDFLSIATVMLTLAGLSLGKDIPLLKNIGWKIIPVGLVAITASFLLSTVIAEFALGLWH